MCVYVYVCANIQWCLTFNTMLRCISPRDETSSDSKRNEGRLRFHLIWIWILFVFNLLKFIQSAKRALRNSIDAKKQITTTNTNICICIPKIFIQWALPSPERWREGDLQTFLAKLFATSNILYVFHLGLKELQIYLWDFYGKLGVIDERLHHVSYYLPYCLLGSLLNISSW